MFQVLRSAAVLEFDPATPEGAMTIVKLLEVDKLFDAMNTLCSRAFFCLKSRLGR
jgi:hypothetical protein